MFCFEAAAAAATCLRVLPSLLRLELQLHHSVLQVRIDFVSFIELRLQLRNALVQNLTFLHPVETLETLGMHFPLKEIDHALSVVH